MYGWLKYAMNRTRFDLRIRRHLVERITPLRHIENDTMSLTHCKSVNHLQLENEIENNGVTRNFTESRKLLTDC